MLIVNFQVSRAISAIVNDIGDWGVLSGNWSGKYDVSYIVHFQVLVFL